MGHTGNPPHSSSLAAAKQPSGKATALWAMYYKRQELRQTLIPYPMGYAGAPPQSSSLAAAKQPSSKATALWADHRYYKRQELRQTLIPYPMGYASAPPQSSSLAATKQPSSKATSYASSPSKRPCFLQICRASARVSCKLAGQALVFLLQCTFH
ncbi:hypothetical protein CRG98_001845 [Punica granatum]|uniref:Uncharacterized protein n=1 Tax=Punica granatum TaxID=22663 RepID=A0A2I0LAM0_PUNGR|nr:hypothetical protein CRG98_001845 [Punica granatum]